MRNGKGKAGKKGINGRFKGNTKKGIAKQAQEEKEKTLGNKRFERTEEFATMKFISEKNGK